MNSVTYLALGDSAGLGVGAADGRGYVARVFARLRERWPDASLRNLCRSGATSRTVLDAQVRLANGVKPSLVTVFVGGNDLWRGVPPSVYEGHLASIVGRLSALGAPILLGNVPNLAHAPAAGLAEALLGVTPSLLEERVRAYALAAQRVAAEKGATFVDLLHATGTLRERPEYFSADGFHPSALGYEAWADVVWPVAERIVEERVAA